MYNRVVKRILDLIAGIVALPFLGLITLVIAVLIKAEDRGPVFYNASRIGRKGKPFIMFKYRTMHLDAPDLKMPDGSTYNAPDDPRMTRIGARMRSLSLDELPQLLNIIRGEMSFIGPRPDLEEEAKLYQGDEGRKLEVRPGISGYAQVNGRNAISWHERLALDVEYVQNIGFIMDVRIFFSTIATVFSRQGVYVEQPEAAATVNPVDLVSLVVVAHHEAHYLPCLLNDIIAQDFPHAAIELLLVDSNAGTDVEQRRLMEDTAAANHGFRRVVVLDNPKGYLPHGCNVALAAYEGDVFVRVDAHARIPADFISCIVEVLNEGHDVCGGLRPVILEESSAWKETLLAAEASAFGASLASYRRERVKRVRGTYNLTHSGREVSSVFHGAYRQKVFKAVGNYDERLLRTEDNDMSQRIRAAGHRIWMDPRIQSEQYLRPSLGALLRQKAANGYWIGRTLWAKPKAVSLLHLVPLTFVLTLLAGAIFGFFLSWLPLLVLSGIYVLVDVVLSLAAALKSQKARLWMLALPLVFPAMHLGYGFGTLAGSLRGPFLRSPQSSSSSGG